MIMKQHQYSIDCVHTVYTAYSKTVLLLYLIRCIEYLIFILNKNRHVMQVILLNCLRCDNSASQIKSPVIPHYIPIKANTPDSCQRTRVSECFWSRTGGSENGRMTAVAIPWYWWWKKGPVMDLWSPVVDWRNCDATSVKQGVRKFSVTWLDCLSRAQLDSRLCKFHAKIFATDSR